MSTKKTTKISTIDELRAKWEKLQPKWKSGRPKNFKRWALHYRESLKKRGPRHPTQRERRLFWDEENWQAPCHECHSEETANGG